MDRFSELFLQFIDNRSTKDEKNELFELINRSENDSALQQMIDSVIANMKEEAEVPEAKAATILSLILQTGRPAKKRSTIRPLIYWPAAAVLLLAIGTLIFYSIHNNNATHQQPAVAKTTTVPDVQPATQGALLTLADGSTIVLDSAEQGAIAQQSGTQVNLQSGQLSYDARQAEAMQYNTLATPRGRIFRLVLPDGSAVWLNAESSIKYPTSFTGDKRIVELNGEAYFEVAPSSSPKGGGKKRPFLVRTNTPSGNKQEVEVLGTHFNVNAYDNEVVIKTTLLEGKVKVVNNTNGKNIQSVILKPGQQATAYCPLPTAGSPLTIHEANIEQVMSWKNGIFNFDNADIKTVMRQLERWYNIEVIYEQGVPDLVFGGKMGRDLTLTHVLRILQISKVHFRLHGNRLIVTP